MPALLLTIPAAVLGGYLAVHEWIPETATAIHKLESDEEDALHFYREQVERGNQKVFPPGFICTKWGSRTDGIIADGKEELERYFEIIPALRPAFERALIDGGDPDGTLVNAKNYGWGMGWIASQCRCSSKSHDIYLLPTFPKRIAYVLGGILLFGLGVILIIGSITRAIRWAFQGLFMEGTKRPTAPPEERKG